MRLRILLATLAAIPVSLAPSAAAQSPLERYYFDRSAATNFDSIFGVQIKGKSGPRVFIVVGDLDDVIADGRYRPNGLVVPTNTSGELDAMFPITQRVLVKRATGSPVAIDALRRSIKAARARSGRYAFLDLGVGSLTIRMSSTKNAKLPGSVCLLATDNRGGGSISQRDFFYQDRIATGVGGCLQSLGANGAMSVAMPLVGSALFATADGALNGPERGLVKCRMLNSVSGIARAVSALPPTTKVREVAIIVWRNDLERLFGTADKDRRRADFSVFAGHVKASLVRGLSGSATTPAQVNSPQCQNIFGPGAR